MKSGVWPQGGLPPPVSPAPCADEGAVMGVAMTAGKLLLENGAEIFRIEETMERISCGCEEIFIEK